MSYCFEVVNRATLRICVLLKLRQDSKKGESFCEDVEYSPFCIRKVLTDNGKEFTNCSFYREVNVS